MVPMFSRVHHIAQIAKSPVFAIPSSARDVSSKGLWKEMSPKQLSAAREQGEGYRKYFIEIAGNIKKSCSKLLRNVPAGDLEVKNVCFKPEYIPPKARDLNNLNKLEWVRRNLKAIMRTGKREALNLEEADWHLNISETKHFQELIEEWYEIKKPKSWNIEIVSKEQVNFEPSLTDPKVMYEKAYNEMEQSKSRYAEGCSNHEKKILLMESKVERAKTTNDDTLEKLEKVSIEVSNKESLLTEKTSEWEQKLTNFQSEIRLKDQTINNLRKVASESAKKLDILKSNLDNDSWNMKLKMENKSLSKIKNDALTKKKWQDVEKLRTSRKAGYWKLMVPKADLDRTTPVKNNTLKEGLNWNELSCDMNVESATKSAEVLRFQQETLSTAEDELRKAIDLLCNCSEVVEKMSKLWTELEGSRILDSDMAREHQAKWKEPNRNRMCESCDLAMANPTEKDSSGNQGTVCSPGQEISSKTRKQIKKMVNLPNNIISSTNELYSTQVNLGSEMKNLCRWPIFFENGTQRRGKSDDGEGRAVTYEVGSKFTTALTEIAIDYLDNTVTAMIEFAKLSNFKSSTRCDTNVSRRELLKRPAQSVMSKALDNCSVEWKLREANEDISRKYGTLREKSLYNKVLKMQLKFSPKSILGGISIRSRPKMKETYYKLIRMEHSPALNNDYFTAKEVNFEKDRSSATMFIDGKRIEIQIILPASILRSKFANYIFMTEQDYHGFRKNIENRGKFSFKVAGRQEAQDKLIEEKAKGEKNIEEKPDFVYGVTSGQGNSIVVVEDIRLATKRRKEDEHLPTISFKVVNDRQSRKRRACYDFASQAKKKCRILK